MVEGALYLPAKHVQIFCDHTHFWYKLRPFGVNDSVRPGCNNEETNNKSIRIDVATLVLILKIQYDIS